MAKTTLINFFFLLVCSGDPSIAGGSPVVVHGAAAVVQLTLDTGLLSPVLFRINIIRIRLGQELDLQ